MGNKQRLYVLGFILIGVSLIVLSGALFFLYSSQIETEKIRLMDMVESQASLIESVTEFDAENSQFDDPDGAEDATLRQIIESQIRYPGFGNSGEFVIGQAKDGKVTIIVTSRQTNTPIQPINQDDETALPIKLALSGEKGIVQSLDYKNEEVLAAYIPLTKLNAGLVAKIDMAELNAPFIRSAILAFILTVSIIIVGIYLFSKIGNPIVRHLEKTIVGLKEAEKNLLKKEKSIKTANIHIKSANKAKSDFVANISHELRTPLNAIIGFSELLTSNIYGPLGHEKYQVYSEYIYKSGEHLLRVINNILDISKIEAGKIELEENEFNLNDAIKPCLSMLNSKAIEKNTKLCSNIPDGLPLVFGDQGIFTQVILNILSNAIKFTNEGGDVEISALLDQNNNLIITVTDQGIGIKEKDIPGILEPFNQVDNSFDREHSGTGLGLPLSKSFIELHDGTMEIKSKINAGTTVTLMLPRERLRFKPQLVA